jgi:hypothetical protein
MRCNVGKTERVVRIIAGLVLIGFGVLWKIWLATIGVLLLLTAILAWCPVSALFGISTCRYDDEEIPADTTEGRSGRPTQDRRFK